MFEDLLKRIAQGLDARKIPYMVIGGQAVLIYGQARATNDIDISLGVGPEGFADVLNWVRGDRWEILVPNPETFMKETMVLPCRDPGSKVRVDFIFSYPTFERTAIARARAVHIQGAEVRVAIAEDLIIFKIIAGRPRDLDDVRGILLKSVDVDLAFVRKILGQVDPESGVNYLARLASVIPDKRKLP